MGRKRKGVGATTGSRPKAAKVPKKTEDTDEQGILAIKLAAKTGIKHQYHDIMIPWLEKQSIESTKISELASLLFLNKVRLEYDRSIASGDWRFFDDGDGYHIIESCFFAVLGKYKDYEDMIPEFRDSFEAVDDENRLAWPNNNYFGNNFKYLYQQYDRNVVTNLTTHAQSRLRQFLRLIVWQHNNNNPNDRFDEIDIKNAVNWAIKRFDSTRLDAQRMANRNRLLEHVRQFGGPDDDDIAKFTKEEWFASLPLWLYMQSQITEYHDWMANNDIPDAPKIKNLCVIPICSHERKPVKIDADVLYRMMCDTGICPRNEYGTQVKVGHVTSNKEHYFKEIFNMEKINRMLKVNKTFYYHVVSDGVSMSILYKVRQTVLDQLITDGVVKKRYEDGFYVYELAIDPNMKTWMAVVRRDIQTGKEVCAQHITINIDKSAIFKFISPFV
ncbi:MAG: hypothetical protein EOP45_16460 [Sphingobacteriaceae bacterium]|nr:MAG: hypothetical protein EOP45_16460 [Sphingobacteriaceae bacterium]